MQILVSKERRLTDAFAIEQAEAAVKRGRRRTGLLEQIGVRPIAHTLYEPLGRLELAEDVRRTDVRVMHRVARRVARAPFGEVQRQRRER
jgi:hypothetical protein